jgi:hypothetical protein
VKRRVGRRGEEESDQYRRENGVRVGKRKQVMTASRELSNGNY